MSYHVYYDNAYDSTDYIGEFSKDELAGLLRQTGYHKFDRRRLTVVEGRELSTTDLDAIANN